VLLLLRGDHSLNEIKAAKVPMLGGFRFATAAEIEQHMHCVPGYIGPVGVSGFKVIADRSVAVLADFVCGANDAGYHLTGVNWGRDLPEPDEVADIRNVVAGDPSPDGKGRLELCRGIEVGHIFQLRRKYSEKMKATFLDEKGGAHPFEMGCYGIGVTRIVAAAIEQKHDAKGAVFPAAIAPFEACVVPIGYHKSAAVKASADQLCAELLAAGVDALLDDRDERPGILFADMELIGVPHRLVVSEKGLAAGTVEYKGRQDEQPSMLPRQEAVAAIKARLAPA
jgi:prolyl-tRNA synthetase